MATGGHPVNIPMSVNVESVVEEFFPSRCEVLMADRTKAEVAQEVETCALDVIALQKEIYELEQRRDEADPPPDLEDQIRVKSDALKEAESRWAASKAEAEAAV